MKHPSALLLLILPATLYAQSPDIGKIESSIRQALPNTTIDSVTATPIQGLMEVVAGKNVFYTDAEGRYLLVGSLYDIKSATDLTAERKTNLNRIAWSSLPLASVVIHGKAGAPKVAIFHDPDCGWCRKLHEQLRDQPGLEVYTILYPVEGLHPDAKRKSAAILCSPDPDQALELISRDKPLANKPSETCLKQKMAALDATIAFAKQNSIQGTPTLIAEDGRIRAGYLPYDQLKQWLTQGTTAVRAAP